MKNGARKIVKIVPAAEKNKYANKNNHTLKYLFFVKKFLKLSEHTLFDAWPV